MGIYSKLTDEQLDAKIVELTSKLEGGAGGTNIKSVWAEDQRLEYGASGSAAQLKQIRSLLNEAISERDARAGGGDGLDGHAIGVIFP